MTEELLEIYNDLLDAFLTEKMGKWKPLIIAALLKAYNFGKEDAGAQGWVRRKEYKHENNNL